MKHLAKFLLLFFVLASTTGFSQNLKFGHINSQELISLMSERDSALVKLEKYADDLDETLQAMRTEFQTKYTTYQQRQATWTAAVLEARQKELQDIDARITSFQQTASQEYQQMQQILFAPVIQKATDAITKIGKEQGLIYIFDTSTGAIPYINDSMSVNVLPLAKTELKIPADKKPMQIGGGVE